jgi:hypothetical protein
MYVLNTADCPIRGDDGGGGVSDLLIDHLIMLYYLQGSTDQTKDQLFTVDRKSLILSLPYYFLY